MVRDVFPMEFLLRQHVSACCASDPLAHSTKFYASSSAPTECSKVLMHTAPGAAECTTTCAHRTPFVLGKTRYVLIEAAHLTAFLRFLFRARSYSVAMCSARNTGNCTPCAEVMANVVSTELVVQSRGVDQVGATQQVSQDL